MPNKHEKLVPLLRAGTVTGPGSEAQVNERTLYPLPAAPELHCSLRAAARVPWTAAGPGLLFKKTDNITYISGNVRILVNLSPSHHVRESSELGGVPGSGLQCHWHDTLSLAILSRSS